MTNLIDRRATFWVVTALTVVLFALTNLPWHLDDYDQAKQAFTSFEMVQLGHWLYQHTPNWWVATKPPFVGWISAGFFAMTRSWDLAWRLPSFLASLALFFLIAKATAGYGRAAVLVAAGAFSLNLFAPRLATLVRTDAPLALTLFLIGWLIWEKIRRREIWQTRDRVVFFVLLSAGMLTKGPIVYAFLLPGIIAFQWRSRGDRGAVTAWCGWWPWLASLAIFLAWVIGGIFLVPEFHEHVVAREFIGRFGEATHRSQPVYFYLLHFMHRFAPWSFLLILLPILAARRQGSRVRDWLRGISPETFWLVAWSLGGLVVMSFIPSKRTDRIFPIVPPLCLLLAVQVAEFGRREKSRAMTVRFCTIAIVFACVFTSTYAAGRIISAYRANRGAFAKFGALVRQEAATHAWNYAVVGGEDEGMALYLRKTEFLAPERAVTEWSGGKLDGLVVPEDELAELLPRLPGAVPSGIGMSEPAGRYRTRYVFLVRS